MSVSLQFGMGWRETMPPEAVSLLERVERELSQNGNAVAAIQVLGDDWAGSGSAFIGLAIPQQDGSPSFATACAFGTLSSFLGCFARSDVERASIVFVNLNPHLGDESTRPNGAVEDSQSLAISIERFARAVSESLAPEDEDWSSCSWAMISAARQPGDSVD